MFPGCWPSGSSVNSYHRLLPQHWSSAFVCWGPDNREATVRVPSTFWGMEQASTNLEFKPTDASCNPYLAFGGLIAAGLDGMERELEAPEPLSVDPATLPDREREAAGAHRYPTLQDSIEALERDQVLVEALGDLLARIWPFGGPSGKPTRPSQRMSGSAPTS